MKYTVSKRDQGRYAEPKPYRYVWAIVRDHHVIVARRTSESDALELAARLNAASAVDAESILQALVYS